jgi:predicted nucleic acid-binding Zn ribbon protein
MPLDRIAMCISKKECIVCGKQYTPYRPAQKFCSGSCKRKMDQQKYKNSIKHKKGLENISASRIGDISELEVTAYYLKEGYEVFRNVSSIGPADIVVWNPEDNTMHLIDIKTYSSNPGNVENFIKKTEKDNGVKVVPYDIMEKQVYREI